MELELRDLEVRNVDTEARTFTGLAVPYGETANVGYTERFEAGAFGAVDNVKLFYGHSDPIGKVISGRDTEAGYEITARISQTAKGDEVYTLMRDGVLNRLSVGFVPVESRTEEDGSVTRTKVDLKEVSVVPFPAYAGAEVSAVRAESNDANANITKEDSNESTHMENENVYDDSELRSELEVVKRELAVVRENGVITQDSHGTQFRNAGEWANAYLRGEANAVEEARAVVTSASGHFSNDWRGGVLTVINNGRPLVNLFEQNTIAHGHKTFEFLKALATSGAVAVQSSEGATIANMSGSVSTDTGTVSTYAGYIDVAIQVGDFNDVDLTDGLIRAAAASYAKVTNDAFRTAFTGATPQTGASVTLSSATAGDWITSIVDAVEKIQANGTLARSVDFAVVSVDVFNKMAATVDGSGRPVFSVNGGNSVNGIGAVNPLGLTLNVAGLPVVLDTGLGATSKSFYVASRNAVGSWENAGAPLDLQAVNVTALTKQYALYGYYAAKVKDANGLVKVAVA